MFKQIFAECCHKMYVGAFMNKIPVWVQSLKGVETPTPSSEGFAPPLPPPIEAVVRCHHRPLPSLSPCLACPPRAGPRFLEVPERCTRGTAEKPGEIPGSFPAKFRESGVLSRARLPARPPAASPFPCFLASFLLTFYRNIVTVSSVFVVAFSLFLWPVF